MHNAFHTLIERRFWFMRRVDLCVGPGWFPIILRLCEAIDRHLESKPGMLTEIGAPYPFEVVQVKEKFGGLRFYTSWETDRIGRLIRAAESLSVQTCDRCGDPGERRGDGWITTRCDACAK